MSWDLRHIRWKKTSKEIALRWPKLTPDQIEAINGNETKLLEQLQEVYCASEEEAKQQVEQWKADNPDQVFFDDGKDAKADFAEYSGDGGGDGDGGD